MDLRFCNLAVYPLVFQCFSEPVGIAAPVCQQPLRLWQTAQQGRSIGTTADLARGHEETDRAPISIRDSMQFGVHATLSPTDQAAPRIVGTPFFNRRLVAVRCAFK